jgi:hypothetical protein
MTTWNPISPRSWADALGLAYVPLFPANRRNLPDEHAVLLDGAKASFHVVATSDSDVIQSDLNLQWSWSSNVLHSVAIDTRRGSLFLRRWDAPDHIRKFKLPTRKVGADELVEVIRSGAPPKAADVILPRLFYEAIKDLPLLSAAAVARQLGWGENAGLLMYRRLKREGYAVPPLKKQQGRRLLAMCEDCGATRTIYVTSAIRYRPKVCRPCCNKRKGAYSICPDCGKARRMNPGAIKRLSDGAKTRCLSCSLRARRGPRGRLLPSPKSTRPHDTPIKG